MLDKELFFRGLLDGAGDALAVLRPKNQRAEDQQIQRALQEFEAFFLLLAVFLGRHLT